ncbi:MAG: hypothetical protein QXM96_04165 [Candidatus Woesearchaeota archaeon]
MEEKKYTKTKLFLFLFFFLILIVFFVNVYNFIKGSFINIENKKNEINCISFKYDVKAEKINSNIYIILKNYGSPIENFTILENNKTIFFYELDKKYLENETDKSKKEKELITIKTNLTDLKEIYFYVNDCKESLNKINIKN